MREGDLTERERDEIQKLPKMCIAVFMWQADPKYPFLLLLNRDEFYSRWVFLFSFSGLRIWVETNMDRFIYRWALKIERPTESLAWWGGEMILAARDALGGGTWLGSTRDGRIAFLTNFREVENLPHPKTRGDLPLRFLQVRSCTPPVCFFVSQIITRTCSFHCYESSLDNFDTDIFDLSSYQIH